MPEIAVKFVHPNTTKHFTIYRYSATLLLEVRYVRFTYRSKRL